MTATESVWDYPRPPAIEPSDEHVVVTHRGKILVDTHASYRVLETSHPPAYYLPLADTDTSLLVPVPGQTWCEFKGAASYADIVVNGEKVPRGVWWYENPTPGFLALVDHIALYPGLVDECRVDGEIVLAQDGDFYGGWITSRVTGPFKGAPGTLGW